MKILVPLKRVADPDNVNKVKVSPDGQQVLSEGLEWKINPYDEYALEAALRLNENAATKEKLDEVVVVCLGPSEATSTIRQALAMGADRAILIPVTDERLDTGTTANLLKAIVARENPNLVLMGKIAVDSDSNAVGQYLAEKLGWPMATMAMDIHTEDGGETLRVGRELDTGVLYLRVTTPAVLTASDRIIRPNAIRNGVTPANFRYPESDGGRYASLKGIMAAKKKPIEEIPVTDLDVAMQNQVTYLRFELPPSRSGQTQFVQSAQELVENLHRQAKVI